MKKSSKKIREFKNTNIRKRNRVLFIILIILVGTLGIYYVFTQFGYSITDIFSFSTIDSQTFPNNINKDFEDDEIGLFPSGDWLGESFNGTKVIKWRWTNDPYGNVVEVANDDGKDVEFGTNFQFSTDGIIEFDVYGDKNKLSTIRVCQEDDNNPNDDIVIQIAEKYGQNINIRDGDGNFVKILDFVDDQWFHFKIQFGVSSWILWIDGNLINSNVLTGFNFNYLEIPYYFSQLEFSTYEEGNTFYLDNIIIDVK